MALARGGDGRCVAPRGLGSSQCSGVGGTATRNGPRLAFKAIVWMGRIPSRKLALELGSIECVNSGAKIGVDPHKTSEIFVRHGQAGCVQEQPDGGRKLRYSHASLNWRGNAFAPERFSS